MDLVSAASGGLRPGAPFVRDERVTLSLRLIGALLDGRAGLGDVNPDFVREVRAAASDAHATLILPAGPGPARVEINGRQWPIPAALRETLAGSLAAPVRDGAAAPASVPPLTENVANAAPHAAQAALQLPTQALILPGDLRCAAANAAAANALAASGALRGARNEDDADAVHPAPFEAPVFDPRTPAATAERIAARVGGSGVFFESHVAQWLRGERSAASLRAEAADLERIAAQDPVRADVRGTRQVETLQRQAIALSGPAWQGQPMQLELGRDPHTVRDAEEQGHPESIDPVFVARLRLELPHLGAVEVRLRLAGDRIAARIEGASAGGARQLVEALPEFGAALAARGLRPVLLQAMRAGRPVEAA